MNIYTKTNQKCSISKMYSGKHAPKPNSKAHGRVMHNVLLHDMQIYTFDKFLIKSGIRLCIILIISAVQSYSTLPTKQRKDRDKVTPISHLNSLELHHIPIYNIYFVHLIKKYSFSNKYSTIINNSNSCNFSWPL